VEINEWGLEYAQRPTDHVRQVVRATTARTARAETIRRQRWMAAGASGAAVIAMVALAGAALRAKGSINVAVTVPTRLTMPAAPTRFEAQTTMADKGPAADRPTVLVAATSDNKIVRLDPQTGAQQKVLIDLTGRLVDGPSHGSPRVQAVPNCVAFDKANATVYFSWGLPGDCDANAGRISSVPVDGGLETQIIGAADTFSVSPDGALMYYRSAPPAMFKGRVRNLKTHSDTIIIDTPDCVPSTVGACQLGHAFWSPDSSAIYANCISYSSRGGRIVGDAAVIRRFDTSTRKQKPESGETTPFNEQANNIDTWNRFGIVGFLDEHRVLRFATNAGSSALQLARPAHPIQTLDVVDAKTGTKTRTLVSLAADRLYVSIGADASGQHVLYASTKGGEAGDLRVSDRGSANAVLLASKIYAAAW
jgi:hypothetical protein